MTGILLVTHGTLGDSLLQCVCHVIGRMPQNLKVLPVQADDDPARKEAEGRAMITRLDTGGGVLLLSDMFGATPCNIAQRLIRPGHVEGVAGLNLPMLLRVVGYQDRPLAELAQLAVQGGRECIVLMDGEHGHNVAA